MPDTGATPAIDQDALYLVVPDQFIAARNALVRRLRSEGAKAEAGRVAALRRPPPTAWALNQVARTAPALIEQVLVAGSALRAATERALVGDAGSLRPAQGEERAALDAVVAEAVRGLEQRGMAVTDATRSRMAATLRAAIVDQSVATRLGLGVLAADHDAPGFGMDALAGPEDGPSSADDLPAVDEPRADEPRADEPRADEPASLTQQQQQDEKRRRDAEEEAVRLSAEAEELSAEADRLAGEADRLGEEAERLSAEAERMAAQAHHARQGAADARLRADAAAQRATAAAATVTAAREPEVDRPS